MTNIDDKKIKDTIEALCFDENYFKYYNDNIHNVSNPSIENLEKIIELLKKVLFPGYFGESNLKKDTMKYYVGVNIDKLITLLNEQLKRGFCFECKEIKTNTCRNCEDRAKEIVTEFITEKLPIIRETLLTDVEAAYKGDPAATNYGEIIFCYPALKALINYRVAHELFVMGVPIIPRIFTEMAHSQTGIDIHPGAKIGKYFTIDHGTGVVIGETCIIGDNVKIYQGVTLGAKSFPLDKNGNPIKGIPRHPIVKDNVVIYAQATILGRITVGENSVIGGNVWVTNDVEPNSKLSQSKPKNDAFLDGGGI